MLSHAWNTLRALPRPLPSRVRLSHPPSSSSKGWRRTKSPTLSLCFSTSASRLVIKPFKLADIGEGITECEIVKWSVVAPLRFSRSPAFEGTTADELWIRWK